MLSDAAEAGRTAFRVLLIADSLSRAWLRVLLRQGSLEEEIYRAVVRLGPTAIKLAQVASTRADFVSPTVAHRLESLQEAAPLFSFAEAREVVEQQLGGPIDALFGAFPREPIASASLSQVYFATLANGSEVAVKVQRPDIAAGIRRDVRILRAAAWFATRLRPSLRNLRLVDAAKEFGRWTLRELDFRAEGKNADEFRRNFQTWPGVKLPVIHWSHTNSRVLTMERVGGRRVKDMLLVLDDNARLQLVRYVADVIMKMFVDDGVFHADLHPGNIFFDQDGRVVLLDVGMVGRMNRSQTDRFLAYWMAISRRQRDRAFHHLLALADSSDRADVAGFRAVYEQILDAFEGSTVTEKSLARTYLDVVQSGANHGVAFPVDMLLQAKALVTMEALCLAMAPGFRFSEELRPIVARRLASRASPRSLLDTLWTLLPDLVITGECIHPGRQPINRHVETEFRQEAIAALSETWVDAADAWLSAHRDARRLDVRDRPELLALLDLAAQVAGSAFTHDTGSDELDAASDETAEQRWASFRRSNRLEIANGPDTRATTWRRERFWLDVIPAAFLPLARVALARTESALREHIDHAAGLTATTEGVLAVPAQGRNENRTSQEKAFAPGVATGGDRMR